MSIICAASFISLGEDVVNDAYVQDLDNPATQQIEAAEQKLFDLAQTGEVVAVSSMEKSLAQSLRMADEAYKRDSHVTGITTGLRDLDRRLGRGSSVRIL